MPKIVDKDQLRTYCLNRLYWFGDLSRKELARTFDVGPDLASRFIGEFRKEVPLAASGKRYVLAPGVSDERLLMLGVSGERFLRELGLAVHGADQADVVERRIGGGVPCWTVERYRNAVIPSVLQALVRAMLSKKAIEIIYVGTGLGENARKRTVEPLGLVQAVGRWHLDAYCYLAREQRSFVVSRITGVGDTHAARYNVAALRGAGDARESKHTATFKPHPLLTPDQRAVVGREFNMAPDLTLTVTDTRDRLWWFKTQFVVMRAAEEPPRKLLVEVPVESVPKETSDAVDRRQVSASGLRRAETGSRPDGLDNTQPFLP